MKDRVSKREVAQAATRILLTSLPVVGGPAVELFNWVSEAPLQRRHQAVVEQITADLEELRQRMGDDAFAEAVTRDQFVTLALQAARAAAQTHTEEKRRLLRSFLMNAALKPEADEDFEQVQLALLERLTRRTCRSFLETRAPYGDPRCTIP